MVLQIQPGRIEIYHPFASPNSINEKKMMIRSHLEEILRGEDTFDAKSEKLADLMNEIDPEAVREIEHFQSGHREMIQEMQELGWEGLKEKYGSKMKTERGCGDLSFEDFRKALVDQVVFFCQSILKAMGYEEVGEHKEIGTPGYNSDIDTVFLAPPGMSEEDQVKEWIFFHLIWNYYFKGLPGFQADTESYLRHPAAKFATARKLQSVQAKGEFTRIELSLAFLQMYRANPDHWSDFVKEEESLLGNIALQICEDILDFEHAVKADMIRKVILENHLKTSLFELENIRSEPFYQELLLRDPFIEKKALINVWIPRLIRLSKEMDQDKSELEKMREAVAIEFLELRLAIMGAIRNACFKESYLTQGADNTVCLYWGGQIHQGKKRNITEFLQRHDESFLKPISLKLGFHQRLVATPVDLLASQQENLSFYEGHFLRKKKRLRVEEALISASKYSKRALDATLDLVKAMSGLAFDREDSEVYQKLENEVKRYHFYVSELEQCKRCYRINSLATKTLLQKFLEGEEEIFEAVCSFDEPGGKFYNKETLLPEETLIPRDKFVYMALHLDDKKCLRIENEETLRPNVTDILKARAGFPWIDQDREDRKLKEIHQVAKQITLEELRLTTPEDIQKFNCKIHTICREVKELAFMVKLVTPPLEKNHENEFSLLSLWEGKERKKFTEKEFFCPCLEVTLC